MDLPVKEPKLDSNNLDYLKSVLNIRDGKAEAYLLTRKGYSSSGIAKRIGTSDSTVKTYLNQLEDTYGVEAIFSQGENPAVYGGRESDSADTTHVWYAERMF